MSWRFYICILVVIELQEKVIRRTMKSGQICPPLVLSVVKKGLGLEGLTNFNITITDKEVFIIEILL